MARAAGQSVALKTRVLEPRDYDAWNRLVASSAEGSVYSMPEYLDALCSSTGGRFRILAVDRGDELAGGVALYEEAARWGRFVSPRLLLYYNGPVLRSSETRYPSQRTSRLVENLEAIEEGVALQGFGRVAFRCRSPLADVRAFVERGWRARPSYSYVVDVTDLEKAWSRVEQNLRRLVGRCDREGVSFSEDDDFRSFYALHAQTHERKGASLYLPEPAFARYFRTLHASGLARLFHARLPDGRSIATQLVLLGLHPVSHTVAAATDAAHLNLGASAFLRWNVFRWLSAAGKAANDLTDAPLSPVTHFKAQLGGDLQLSHWVERPESAGFRFERAVKRAEKDARGAWRRLRTRRQRR